MILLTHVSASLGIVQSTLMTLALKLLKLLILKLSLSTISPPYSRASPPSVDAPRRVDAIILAASRGMEHPEDGGLHLRGGSRATSAMRSKAKLLAKKLEWNVESQRRKTDQKMRDKIVNMASSASSKRQDEIRRIEQELGALEESPFDPPRDSASLKAAGERARYLASKYTPGQIVELEDSEEWHRETEGDPSKRTTSLDVFEDQTQIIREHNARYASSEPKDHETCDEWDVTRPDGAFWGEDKVPKLEWGQDAAEIAGLLGDEDEQRSLEQWIGEEALHELQLAQAAARKNASIDVDARVRELYAELARESNHSSSSLPQAAASRELCRQVPPVKTRRHRASADVC